MKAVRCAIYTRKSSEEGLEQDFNSLDAQREACAAYILSQAGEGWSAITETYDDGGLSGGSLERPALQRLLEAVDAGRIDIIVVYKVDRLTRSLLDFSKLVERFDCAKVSFVSVTQAFNTTNSMGRLTLNMLLSFAQFEREVTAERIRDKIAASKAKGMWMGGIAPVGYRLDGRTLAIVEADAVVVRKVFEGYLEVGNVRLLGELLERSGIGAPARLTSTSGRAIGGRPFSRGQLYHLLRCRTYLGEIEHRGSVYPGLHPAIIGRDVWDAVQELLAANLQGARNGVRARSPSLLAGIIEDDEGRALKASHSVKGTARHRYYCSDITPDRPAGRAIRLPAREIETLVVDRLAKLFDDPFCMFAEAGIGGDCAGADRIISKSEELAGLIRQRTPELLRDLTMRVRVGEAAVVIEVRTAVIARLFDLVPEAHGAAVVTLATAVRIKRRGQAKRLVQDNGAGRSDGPDQSMVRVVATGHRYWHELRQGAFDVTALARREGVTPSWVTRAMRLAFLSPNVVEAILAGRQHAALGARSLVATGAVDPRWCVQERTMLPGR